MRGSWKAGKTIRHEPEQTVRPEKTCGGVNKLIQLNTQCYNLEKTAKAVQQDRVEVLKT